MSAPRIQLVVKISKYCNLRCDYCYEFNELSDKTRISLANIERMLRNLRSAIDAGKISGIEFIWHGGEPFLISLDYYRKIGEFQGEIFSDREDYQNFVQTNLTVLTDRHVEFLKSGNFFDRIGVSFDVFGGQRVDTKGKLRDGDVLVNMQKLIDHEIDFGAISVLSRDTLGHAHQTQKFWEAMGMGFRFLPFHLSVDNAQSRKHGLSGQEQVMALSNSFVDWLAAETPNRIDPVSEYLGYALEFMANGARTPYDPVANEIVYVVNVNGSISGIGEGELYSPDLSYGNVFTTPFADVIESPVRRKASALGLARMDRHCRFCPYFGYCPGHHMADASTEDMRIIESNGCTVRHIVGFIVKTLERSEIGEELNRRLRGEGNGADAGTRGEVSRALL